MFKLIKNHICRTIKEVEEHHKAEKEALAQHEAEKEADRLNDKMESKFCPIVNGKCRKTCVHFNKSVVLNMYAGYAGYDDKYWRAIKPGCKLWK